MGIDADAIDRYAALFDVFTQEDALKPAPDGSASARERLGWLIDATVENHPLFIEAQARALLRLPGERRTLWVSAQHPEVTWPELILYWQGYAHHLLKIIDQLPDEALRHTVVIGDAPPTSLAQLVLNYLDLLDRELPLIFRQLQHT